ncbi:MAG: T9SS type A sorting domain-containing protein [Cytophagaceae bacterium]|nr:T9SS type A sorting domain-containing protein [Cytophagaceae bacterium]
MNAAIAFIELAEDEEQVSLDIIDSFGKKIASVYQGSLQAGNHTLDLNSTVLAPGIYILSLKSQHSNQNKVFIKQ